MAFFQCTIFSPRLYHFLCASILIPLFAFIKIIVTQRMQHFLLLVNRSCCWYSECRVFFCFVVLSVSAISHQFNLSAYLRWSDSMHFPIYLYGFEWFVPLFNYFSAPSFSLAWSILCLLSRHVCYAYYQQYQLQYTEHRKSSLNRQILLGFFENRAKYCA